MRILLLCLYWMVRQAGELYAQKPVLDTNDFGKWPYLSPNNFISHDGNYIGYYIQNQPIGSQTLVVQSVRNGWKREFMNAINGDSFFTNDSRTCIFSNSGDSLVFLSLGGGDIKGSIGPVNRWELREGAYGHYLGYMLKDTVGRFVLADRAGNKIGSYDSITDFHFSVSGKLLLLLQEKRVENETTHQLILRDQETGTTSMIWEGECMVQNMLFDEREDQLLFSTRQSADGNEPTLWRYAIGEGKARVLLDKSNKGIDSSLRISTDQIAFSQDGSRAFLKLTERSMPSPAPDAVHVDVWGYRDKVLQSKQLANLELHSYDAVVVLRTGKLFRLQQAHEALYGSDAKWRKGDHCFAYSLEGEQDELYWNPRTKARVYAVSTRDGSRIPVATNLSAFPPYLFNFPSSPNGKWLVFYNDAEDAYYSCEGSSGRVLKITQGITGSLSRLIGIGDSFTEASAGLNKPIRAYYGVGGWLPNEDAILIYDQYDIWKVDPSGSHMLVNLTRGYGRAHHIQLRLLEENGKGEPFWGQAGGKNSLVIRGFDTYTNCSGLYQVDLNGRENPVQLMMGPWYLHAGITKARDADVWVVSKMSAAEPTNYFVSNDLRSFRPLTTLEPQKEVNWLTVELHHYPAMDGHPATGVLYKPTDFDPARYYPVIFYYYERSSDVMYVFKDAERTIAGINIPWFVSHGYLVFVPDIDYKMGEPGASVVNCVAGAARYLAKLPFVNSRRMGINGQSWGGYETSFLVTHTHLFAAAAEMAGPTDYVSDYLGIRLGFKRGEGSSAQYMFEHHQQRIGATLWQRSDLYIKNSPVFSADKATTPLLIAHSWNDQNVPFEQSLELYLALRRLGKPVWLLQYDHGDHIIAEAKESMDYTIRLTQFFDHYLKDAPPPIWMTEGIPAAWKGIKTGYELDRSGVQP